MRSSQFCLEAHSQGGKAEADAWKGIWHAIITCPICRILLDELDTFLTTQACTEMSDGVTHTIEHGSTREPIRTGIVQRWLGRLEQNIFELSYPEAGTGWMSRWLVERYFMVSDYRGGQTNWLDCMGSRSACDEII